MLKTAPLNSSFMLIGIIGFIVSIIFTISGRFTEWFGVKLDPTGAVLYDRGVSFGFAFILVFIFIIIASIVSMSNAPINSEEFLDHRRKK